jgi:DNA-nicking Smr family endonuclease
MSKRRRRFVQTDDLAPPVTGLARLLSETPAATLDLHGFTAEQARLRLRDFFATHSRISAGSVIHLITGKGSGSEGEAVLLGLVRRLLDGELAELVSESAGAHGGGGWIVRLR